MATTAVTSAATPAARADRPARQASWAYYLLFFISGFPALLYQIIWQRSLFTLFGANVESVTIIVTVFMLGLGLGSLLGGRLSARPGMRLLAAFGCVELCTGGFGLVSLWIFHRVAAFTAGSSLLVTGGVAFALLLIPTLLMGSTLPLLAEHFVRDTGNVGGSVGLLYCVNTLGSGLACLAAALFAMRWFGQSGAVHVAVGLNLFAGAIALLLQIRRPTAGVSLGVAEPASDPQSEALLPLPAAMFLAAAAGFIALAWEIVWYRLYSFATAGRATAFPLLLGTYLLGIAYGSLRVRDACTSPLKHARRRLLGSCAEVILAGSVMGFVVGPALAAAWLHVGLLPLLPLFISACLLGAAFPLLAHVAIHADGNAGRNVSLLYLSNIIGCTAGSFLVGFILFDHLSTRAVSVLLLILGLVVALALARLSGPSARKSILLSGGALALLLAIASGPLFSHVYERLLFDKDYRGTQFSEIVENRSGVIAVDTSNGEFGYAVSTVYGGGAYDGRFNTDLVHDTNMLFRMYALAGIQPSPRNVLMIGLSSGSWAQVAANLPGLDNLTIVEINPGYLQLIRNHPEVRSLLTNPRVHIVIDDGRRWLIAHPERRFDSVVMNTTFHWRANNTNLLSVEFLRLVRQHLSPGGLLYYNTTWSSRVLATGISVYPSALRVSNFLAVSDSPLRMDRERWRAALSAWRIDDKPVIDLSDPSQRKALDQVLQLADQLDVPNGGLESRASLSRRLAGVRLITDDNMGTEWEPKPDLN